MIGKDPFQAHSERPVGEVVRQLGPMLIFECGCMATPFSTRGTLIHAQCYEHEREVTEKTKAWIAKSAQTP